MEADAATLTLEVANTFLNYISFFWPLRLANSRNTFPKCSRLPANSFLGLPAQAYLMKMNRPPALTLQEVTARSVSLKTSECRGAVHNP
jgi:hypothetical protein